jgi:Fe2+ or Zn2+ uptake regulation protein
VTETGRQRWLEHAHRRIADAGFRNGAARTAVVEYLAQDSHCLVAAQDVVDALKADGRGSSASVYRALDELLGLGLIHRTHARDGVARFEIAEASAHHHHFIDDATGKVTPFEDQALEEAIHAIGDRLSVDLTSHEVVLRGVQRTDVSARAAR